MIEDALFTLLSRDAGLAALVGNRIYPDVLPQGVTFPAIRFAEVSLTANYHQEGDAHYDNSRYQFDCYAATRADARAICAALRTALSGKRTFESGFEMVSFLVNSISDYDEGLNVWRMIQDYAITNKAR